MRLTLPSFRAVLRALRRDRRGAAAVEFAILSACFFFAFMAVLDFGSFFVSEHRLGQAVVSAGNSAFSHRDSVDFSSIPGYVQNAAGNAAATVNITCNGSASQACTNTGRSCACVSNTGTYTAAICAASCPTSGYSANQKAGYYLTITASAPYSAVIIPNSILKNGTIRRSVTMRLQ